MSRSFRCAPALVSFMCRRANWLATHALDFYALVLQARDHLRCKCRIAIVCTARAASSETLRLLVIATAGEASLLLIPAWHLARGHRLNFTDAALGRFARRLAKLCRSLLRCWCVATASEATCVFTVTLLALEFASLQIIHSIRFVCFKPSNSAQRLSVFVVQIDIRSHDSLRDYRRSHNPALPALSLSLRRKKLSSNREKLGPARTQDNEEFNNQSPASCRLHAKCFLMGANAAA